MLSTMRAITRMSAVAAVVLAVGLAADASAQEVSGRGEGPGVTAGSVALSAAQPAEAATAPEMAQRAPDPEVALPEQDLRQVPLVLPRTGDPRGEVLTVGLVAGLTMLAAGRRLRGGRDGAARS